MRTFVKSCIDAAHNGYLNQLFIAISPNAFFSCRCTVLRLKVPVCLKVEYIRLSLCLLRLSFAFKPRRRGFSHCYSFTTRHPASSPSLSSIDTYGHLITFGQREIVIQHCRIVLAEVIRKMNLLALIQFLKKGNLIRKAYYRNIVERLFLQCFLILDTIKVYPNDSFDRI